MVMGNAYISDTLVYDHIHRRDTESNGIQEYPEQVLRHNERFTQDVARSTWAKVEIIYGVKTQTRFLQTHEVDVVILWGEYEGLKLVLAHETNYRNQEKHSGRRECVCGARAHFLTVWVHYLLEKKWYSHILSVAQ
jgi:hypothetical protein